MKSHLTDTISRNMVLLSYINALAKSEKFQITTDSDKIQWSHTKDGVEKFIGVIP